MLANGTLLQERYRIIRLLARGGMGAVYEAEAVHLGSAPVAVKETYFSEQQRRLREQFEREAATMARLRHPALPRVSDHFIEGGGQFLVMEFVPGDDLFTLLNRRRKPFDFRQVMGWAETVLDALNYIHTQYPPVIHRDIKPQNLKLTPRGELFLIDFGLAKNATTPTHTSASLHAYTLSYASPEQIKGAGTDPRSDLYSLGATLHHLLAGEPPVDARVREEVVRYQAPDPLRLLHQVNPQIPPAVSVVIARAMALDREARYTSAATMLQALREGGSVPGPRESPGHGRVQVLNALVEGRTGSIPGETVEESPVPTATPDARPITARVHGWRPLYILLLTVSSLFFLSSGGWWIYTRFISSSGATIVGASTKGGLGSPPASPSATGGEGNQRPFPERTVAPEVKSPADGANPFKPSTKAGGAVESGTIAGGTNTHTPTVSPRKEQQVADDSRLIGKWQSDVVEYGIRTSIIWQVNHDGTTNYLFVNPYGSSRDTSKWRLSDGVLYEQMRDGRAAALIRWIDDDHFELTILYNQDPRSKGFVRRYSRVF
jgi:serine/threonine protein kinase